MPAVAGRRTIARPTLRVPNQRRSVERIAAMVLAGTLCWSVAGAKAMSRDVEAIISAMTLAEKVAMMHGAEDPLTAQRSPDQRGAGYVVGVPRLGVPPLRLTDGPAGIRTARPATALPAAIALGASFDPELALRFGAVLGGEARAANQDVVLAPMVDIVRTPLAGRAFEALGEDPFLAARLAEAEISGIQSAGAIAAVKHLAANNQEDHRSAIDVHVDERTLREIYLPPFAAAIRAGAGAVMCGYYAVNGVPACQNQMLLDRYLRGELGFTGWVISDWGATHSTLPSLLAGLDMEMWSGARYGVLADMVPQTCPRLWSTRQCGESWARWIVPGCSGGTTASDSGLGCPPGAGPRDRDRWYRVAAQYGRKPPRSRGTVFNRSC